MTIPSIVMGVASRSRGEFAILPLQDRDIADVMSRFGVDVMGVRDDGGVVVGASDARALVRLSMDDDPPIAVRLSEKGALLLDAMAPANAATQANDAVESRYAQRKRKTVASLVAARTEDEVLASLDAYRNVTIPSWFGLPLYKYQEAGIRQAVNGFTMIADEPGLGKTRQGLGVAACWDAHRTVVICPPSVLNHWRREAEGSRIHDHSCGYRAVGDICPMEDAGDCESMTGAVVMLMAGRKIPDMPAKGVVVCPDSLITSRPELRNTIIQWKPDVIIFDESHRAKSLTAGRSLAVRHVAAACPDAVCVAISGTPILAEPSELAPQLEFTGHMRQLFGDTSAFLSRFCTPMKNFPGKFHAQTKELPALRDALYGHVWVRRTKDDLAVMMRADGQGGLPPKLRLIQTVDIDQRLYGQEVAKFHEHVDEWISDFARKKGELPTVEDANNQMSSMLGSITGLRRTAGELKAPVVADLAGEWLAEQHARPDCFRDDGGYDRPLIVWTYHHEVTHVVESSVMKALAKATSDGMTVQCINGGTPLKKRFEIVDEFQAGRVPILLASMPAAGVGLTLTRGSDQWIVEPDWTPAVISQAEDRCHRIGQARPVSVTTLIAPGTLDEGVQATLNRKIDVLDVLTPGGDHHVSVDAGVSVRDVIVGMMMDRVRLAGGSETRAA